MHSLCLLFRTEGAVRWYCGFFYCYKQYETVLSGFAPFPAGRFRGLLTASIPFFYIQTQPSLSFPVVPFPHLRSFWKPMFCQTPKRHQWGGFNIHEEKSNRQIRLFRDEAENQEASKQAGAYRACWKEQKSSRREEKSLVLVWRRASEL